jgi:hypothetical protein
MASIVDIEPACVFSCSSRFGGRFFLASGLQISFFIEVVANTPGYNQQYDSVQDVIIMICSFCIPASTVALVGRFSYEWWRPDETVRNFYWKKFFQANVVFGIKICRTNLFGEIIKTKTPKAIKALLTKKATRNARDN